MQLLLNSIRFVISHKSSPQSPFVIKSDHSARRYETLLRFATRHNQQRNNQRGLWQSSAAAIIRLCSLGWTVVLACHTHYLCAHSSQSTDIKCPWCGGWLLFALRGRAQNLFHPEPSTPTRGLARERLLSFHLVFGVWNFFGFFKHYCLQTLLTLRLLYIRCNRSSKLFFANFLSCYNSSSFTNATRDAYFFYQNCISERVEVCLSTYEVDHQQENLFSIMYSVRSDCLNCQRISLRPGPGGTSPLTDEEVDSQISYPTPLTNTLSVGIVEM